MLTTWLFALALAASASTAPPPASALPPTPHFRRYNIAAGLPSNRVYRTVEDVQGYIWVGTGDGLARFDGTDFTVFRHDPGDPASLPGNDVSALLVDEQGRLWVGGEDTGLNRYNPASGGFRHWMHDAHDEGSLSGNDVIGLAQTADGAIWVAVYAGGVNRLSVDGSHFTALRHHDGDAQSLASDNVMALHVDPQGRLWIGSDAGLDVRTPNGRLQHVRFAGADTHPWAWQIDGGGDDVRVATRVGLFVVGRDLVARRVSRLPSHDAAYASARSADGALWVGVRGGLRLLTTDGRDYAFKTRRLLPGGLAGRVVLDVMRDSEGGLWLATVDAGLLYLSPHWRDFTTFGHVPEDPDSLEDSRILALAREADGQLLVGGPGGELDRLDPRSGAVEHLGVAIGLPERSVNALLADHHGRIWIGLERGLRVLVDGRLHTVGANVLHNGVVWMAQAADGSVYVAPSAQGLFQVDPNSLKLTAVPLARSGERARETNALVAHDGALWRASGAGLSRRLPQATRMQTVAGVTPGEVDALAFRGDALWLARPGSLEHYRVGGGRAQLINTIDTGAAWPSVDITGLLVDGAGRVWATSRVGLWRFDPKDHSLRHYGAEDGLPSPGFSRALVTTGDGDVYAGTLGGMVAFRPLALHDRALPPRLLLTALEVDRDGRMQALPHARATVDLGWRDRDLHVVAQALSYINPQRNHYRFRLRGLDSDWVDTGTRGAREYTALPAGDYLLDVQAAGPSGAWASLPQPLAIHVAAPPWDRPLAWLAYAVLAVLSVWLVWRVARQRVERRVYLHMLEQASAAKTRFLATLGHEIRTPMTGVLGMAELLTHTALDPRQRGFVGAIERSGGVLLKLVNDALDLARIEAGRLPLDVAAFDPAALLGEVAALDAGLAAAKGLAIKVEVADDVPQRVLGDVVRVKQILLNLTGNALKFTDAGSVWLRLARRDGTLVYSVRDSGPGLAEIDRSRLFRRFEQGARDSGSGGSGLGLAICRELASLMGGDVEVHSALGEGSTFVVTLPLPAASDAATAGVAAMDAARRSPWRRILLVEDDAVVRAVIAGLLEAQGHQVRQVGHALAALSELEVAPADVVLVDLDLPDIDGFELIRMLRAGQHHALAIIVVTARTEASDERDARAAGADGFVRKPVSGEQLAAALAAALATAESASRAAAGERADAAPAPPRAQTTDDA